MFKNRLYILLLIFGLSLNTSCYKDDEFSSNIMTETSQTEVLSEFTGSVLGYVYDEKNQPVVNAQIRIYSASATTDEYGVFVMDNVKLDQHGTYLKVSHSDYMLGSDFINASTGTANSRIQMIKLTNDNAFDASVGELINIRGGGTIDFKPNTIMNSQGNDYNGQVEVSTKLIAENDSKIADLMPGSLIAQDEAGKTVILGTAGMVAIELRSPSGEELNIKAGTSATIIMPASLNNLPDEIPTWSFDENTGRWQEEGIAVLESGFYVFDVPHLSFWNCDYPFDLVKVSGRVVNTDGDPVLTNVGVRSTLYGVQYAMTDSDGFFSGKVPANENLEFFTYSFFCYNKNFRKDLGPFDATTLLEDFIIETPVPKIRGQVVCTSVPYSEATIVIESENEKYVYNIINDGDFELNPNLICDNLTTGFIWAYDNVTKYSSPKFTIDFENPIMPVLDICEVICDFQVEVKYECSIPVIELMVVDPQGTYSYNWDTGETIDVLFVPTQTSGIFCVTVTEDDTGCEISLCQETSALSATINADECSGIINVFISNGSAPYTVTNLTTGGSRETNAVNPSFSYFTAGQYCFEVVDKTGCEITNLCISAIEPEIFNYYIDRDPYLCDLNKYYYNANFANWAFVNGPQGNDDLQFDNNGYYINVAIVGYKDITVDFQSNCFWQNEVTTPFFEGLGFDATASSATCFNCTDAQISYTVDPLANCIDCDYGEVKIFDDNFVDVTLENTNSKLGVGTYYVAALDLNTNCFIASQQITINN
ncbi:carboxypeptidase-like regulatory domain-containing protein [bacterium]|nr:carboxypeptidase-like regulatory domain-containing protein [bacterium]